MKTPRTVLTERKKTYKKILSEYTKMTKLLSNLKIKSIDDSKAKEKFDSILVSDRYQELEDILTHGPIYDLPKEDIENPKYVTVMGQHPLSDKNFREIYRNGELYGSTIDGRRSNRVSCL